MASGLNRSLLRGTAASDVAQPRIMSCHAMRSSRRHAKRVEQETHIKSLENQLSSWWAWWLWEASGVRNEIDEEVIQRLQAIEPGIRAQVEAKVRGVSHHSARKLIDAELHVKSNGAKH